MTATDRVRNSARQGPDREGGATPWDSVANVAESQIYHTNQRLAAQHRGCADVASGRTALHRAPPRPAEPTASAAPRRRPALRLPPPRRGHRRPGPVLRPAPWLRAGAFANLRPGRRAGDRAPPAVRTQNPHPHPHHAPASAKTIRT